MKKITILLFALFLLWAAMLPTYADDTVQSQAPQNNTLVTVFVCLLIGLTVGLTATLLMKRSMSTVRKQKRADGYMKKDSFALAESRDIFLYSTVTRIRVNNSNNRK